MKPLLCLDLEGTLISNAISQIPRPGLYNFLTEVAVLCDLVLYTSVSEDRAQAIQRMLVCEEVAPTWFANLDIIRPAGTLKPKSACGREDAFLLDDQEGVIAPGEHNWWIRINEYLPPYYEDDRALHRVLGEIEIRIRLSEPSVRVDLGDL
ncbi:NIF family HAD-type phosphatase [Marinobacter halotolerans]|uniref:NIF family HAD-type phosphatase n=1 Tax=Marinobacter halotolerans TaxID=1569211 RepID=UPI0012465813|nr:NIF family HAD-type phosphatase [Marinobacter halotolerans]